MADQPPVDPPIYADPFAGEGFCELALAVPELFRAAVTRDCPRCGDLRRAVGSLDQSADCLLAGVELDLLALDADV